MASFKGSRSEAALMQAFACDTQASRRYLGFAQQAEQEARSDIAALFRAIAARTRSRARKHLEALPFSANIQLSRPNPEPPRDIRSAIIRELDEGGDQYAGMARAAYQEGLEDIAGWFEVLAKANRSSTASDARAKRGCDQVFFDWASSAAASRDGSGNQAGS